MSAMSNSTYPDFSGKAILFDTIGKLSDEAFLVENVKFEIQAGKLFITGNMANAGGSDNYSRGLPVGIAWDQIQSYIVFDSVQQFIQRKDEYYEDAREE